MSRVSAVSEMRERVELNDVIVAEFGRPIRR